MTEQQLEAIRHRASQYTTTAHWDVLQAQADRVALLALVDQLRAEATPPEPTQAARPDSDVVA